MVAAAIAARKITTRLIPVPPTPDPRHEVTEETIASSEAQAAPAGSIAGGSKMAIRLTVLFPGFDMLASARSGDLPGNG
jgi:hypothetical protein